MAISLYSGTPGSGKSLHAAERIYHILRAGFPVVANFSVNVPLIQGRKKHVGRFHYLANDEIAPSALISISQEWFLKHHFREESILLVIDEAQLLFNARSWDASDRAGWVSFFSQHRKYGYRIILIAQFDRMLDRQIRSLLEYEYVHRRVSNFGIWGKLFSVAALGKLFVAVKVWYPLKEKVGSEWYAAKRRYYQIYDTYDTFDADGAVDLSPAPEGVAPDAGGSPAVPGRRFNRLTRFFDFLDGSCVAPRLCRTGFDKLLVLWYLSSSPFGG